MSVGRQLLLFRRRMVKKAFKAVAIKARSPSGGYLPSTLASFIEPRQLPGPSDRYRLTGDENRKGHA